jgi:cyclopropane-fatty-acyl-phospholipid synthase
MRVEEIAAGLDARGARLSVVLPDGRERAIGVAPPRARVVFHDETALAALAAGDHLRLAESFLEQRIDIEGDPLEVVKVTDLIVPDLGLLAKLRFALRLRLPGRAAYNAASIAFHYDRPPEFFLPWLDRWRSYSHGFYERPDEDLTTAQARKLQHAIDSLGLRPGMRVLDMGGGWGCFVEYAGLQGIHVETITISKEQHRFLERLIADARLPCSVELVDFFDYRPKQRFDAAVFMGTFEHLPEYDRVIAFLGRHLVPGGRMYADFCSARHSVQLGAFLRKHLWPGPVSYVDLPRLVRELVRGGFNLHEIVDDTASYACTVRDWGIRLQAARDELARRFGEPAVRAFLLFFWASEHFLTQNRTQAYHLIAGLRARGT